MTQKPSRVNKLLIYTAVKDIQYNKADSQLQMYAFVQAEYVG